MKKLTVTMLVTLVLMLSVASNAYADTVGDPVGRCPNQFTLHHAAHHDEHHDMHKGGTHLHVGSDTDLNADGWICVRHVSAINTVHLHVDNVVPLP